MALLAVDIGNTSTALGLFAGRRLVKRHRFPTAVTSMPVIRLALLRLGVGRGTAVAVASVVPRLDATWRNACRGLALATPLFVTARLELGVAVSYPRPATIGADRLANASEAFARFGAPAIVADFGTAVTFDVISPDGEYVGGVICPGLLFATDYLADRTALLPRIDMAGRVPRVGRNTEEAMRIGARVGYRGLVREIFTHLQRTTGPATLCATGGNARLALAGIGLPLRFDSDLTLKGIRRIYTLNDRK